jgi:hypothetical protein
MYIQPVKKKHVHLFKRKCRYIQLYYTLKYFQTSFVIYTRICIFVYWKNETNILETSYICHSYEESRQIIWMSGGIYRLDTNLERGGISTNERPGGNT